MFLKHSLSLSGAFPRLNEKEEVGNKKERERERAFFFSFFFFSGRAEGGVTYAARFKVQKDARSSFREIPRELSIFEQTFYLGFVYFCQTLNIFERSETVFWDESRDAHAHKKKILQQTPIIQRICSPLPKLPSPLDPFA